MPTKEVVEHFNRVENRLMNASDEEKSQRFFQNMAGEFLLVIKEAGGIYPEAHGRLSEVFLALDDKKRAQQEYQTALQQDPYEVVAWKTRLSIALAPYAGHTDFRRSSSFQPTTEGVVGSVGRNLVSQGYESTVIKEFKKLLETYRQLVTQTTDETKWVNMSDLILEMADFLYQNDLVWHKGSWPNLYEDVANAPWSKIEGKGYDEAIAEIKQTAEGRLLLYPSTSKSLTASTKSVSPTPRQGSTISEEINRPRGVTVITVLAVINGILGLISSAFSPFQALIGLLNLVFAYSAWSLKPWGWTFGSFLQAVSILISVLTIVGGYSLGSQLLGLIFSVVMLAYLQSDEIKSAFART